MRNIKNQQKFFDQLRDKLGYKCMDDWYNITKEDIRKNGGVTLLAYNNGSPSLALQSAYPEHNWELEKFKNKPTGFWKSNDNQKKFFDHLYNQLGYKCMDDWYNVTADDICKSGGGTLLAYNKGSPSMALRSVYPEHCWELKKFKNRPTELEDNVAGKATDGSSVPRGFWKNTDNQKNFFDRMYNQLGYKGMDDWYNVTVEDIRQNGGGTFLAYNKNSPSLTLRNVYPQHNWELEKFKYKPSELEDNNLAERRSFLGSMSIGGETMPRGLWNTLINNRDDVLKTMDWLGKQLSIESLDDWYRVRLKKTLRKWVPVESTDQLCRLLEVAYPQHRWDAEMLGKSSWKSQGELKRALEKLFPNHRNVLENYKNPQLKHSSGHDIELDVYIEPLKLAFEYQGEQHYKPLYWTGRDFTEQKRRDKEKREVCRQVLINVDASDLQHGITLVDVPYWWDRMIKSLAATIHQVRSDLIPDPPGVDPIPTIDITSTNSSLLTHGSVWDGSQDVTGWWISEKMDGVRAYWNGDKLISRHDKDIPSPPGFTQSLPTIVQLDGELWLGRGTSHEDVMKILNSKDPSGWSRIGFYVFDVPFSPGTYEERMEQMESLKHVLPPHVHIVKNIRCEGIEYLHAYLDSVVSQEGEGAMLRKPHTKYERGYTSSLLKVKRFEDAEVEMIGVVDGGLLCRQSNGLECLVTGLEASGIPLESRIVVKHIGVHSNGVLKHPVYWRQLSVHDEHQQPAPDWRDSSNHKDFFDRLARVMNVSQPTDWYRVKREDIVNQGGERLLKDYYGNSLYKALMHIFPNLPISPWMIDGYIPHGYWDNTNTQRYSFLRVDFRFTLTLFDVDLLPVTMVDFYSAYFDWLMTHLGMKCMEDWYKVSVEDIEKSGGGTLLYGHYNGSPSLALKSVYPEHNWELGMFKNKPTELQNNYSAGRRLFLETMSMEGDTMPRGFWKSTDNQKKFFDHLHNQLGYKCMDDWYNVTQEDICANGGVTLLNQYKNSPSLALRNVYPHHNWELERFKHKPLELQNKKM